jgi:diguanylate cyclase (GGDEF)-like protein/PAS domain S-box-containing protein
MSVEVAVGLAAYRSLYENSPHGVMFSTPDGEIRAANAAACALLDYSEEEILVLGRDGIADTDDPRWRLRIDERRRNGRVAGCARMRRADGKLLDLDMTTETYRDEAGVGLFTILRDVSDVATREHEIEHLHEMVRELTLQDELTGLTNRRGLGVAGERIMELADRRGEDVQALFVEILNLEEIDEAFGYLAGQTALQAVARALSVTFRRCDVVSRIGDGAFQALALDLHESDHLAVEERIVQHLSASETRTMIGLPVQVAFGWYTRVPGDTMPLSELIARADRSANRVRRRSAARRHPSTAEGV